MIRLLKLSNPRFEKSFSTESELLEFFRKCVCDECCEEIILDDGFVFQEKFEKSTASRQQLLATPCGSEYVILEDNETLDSIWSVVYPPVEINLKEK